MLELSQVTAGYGAFTALWDVSLRVNQGEAVAVVGPNGAGKTTLLRAISGLIAPREGRVTFEGAELAGHPAYDIVAHGIAPKYANQDKVNPGSLILSGEMMFRYLGWPEAADLIIRGLEKTIGQKRVTYDFERQMQGATLLSCSAFGQALVENM